MWNHSKTSPSLAPLLLRALPVLLLIPMPAGGAASAPETPREVVERLTKAVTQVLRDPEKTDREKRDAVQGLVEDVVDFDTVSKLVLARNWKRFSEEQRSDFEAEFRRHLMFTYWRNASTVDFERIEIIGEQKEVRRDWTVKTRVIQTDDSALIHYRLRQQGREGDDGEWKVIDVVIEDVSLVSNFRSQFQSIVAEGGPQHLIDLLRKKNAEAEKEQEGDDS